jgi:hypothetical protein
LKSKKKISPVERPLVDLFDTKQVCGILRVNKRTLKRMNVDGRLKPFALLSPNAPRYHPDDIRRFLEQSAPSAEKTQVPRQFLSRAEKAMASAEAKPKGQMLVEACDNRR